MASFKYISHIPTELATDVRAGKKCGRNLLLGGLHLPIGAGERRVQHHLPGIHHRSATPQAPGLPKGWTRIPLIAPQGEKITISLCATIYESLQNQPPLRLFRHLSISHSLHEKRAIVEQLDRLFLFGPEIQQYP